MAAILKLVKTEDFAGVLSTLDLLAFASGFDLEDQGWKPKVSKGDGKNVGEVISLLARGSTSDALAAVIHTLDEKLQQVGFHADEEERYRLFIQTKKDGETNTRQALVVDIFYELAESPYQGAAADSYYYQLLILHVTRKPEWEPTTATEYICAAINCVGGTADYTTYGGSPGVVTGDTPARLAVTAFAGSNGVTGALYKFWMGFRTDRFGTRANFQPYWSLRKAILFDADTTGGTANADATAKDGYKSITTFATVATLLRRATIRTKDVATYPTDQRGHFTVVMRAKLSQSGTVRVRLADGWMPGIYGTMTGQVQGRRVISSTAWNYYALGSVQIPSPGRLVAGISYLENYALGIDAERVSGSCNLEIDCVVMIPDNEGFVYAEGGVVEYVAGDTRPLYVHNYADGKTVSVALSANSVVCVGIPNTSGGLPLGNGIIVLAGQRGTTSTLADVVDVRLYPYQRWRTLRGAE